MKENEKPEGLAKGKFVTLTGTCKYCGNQRFVRVDPDEPQEKIDEYASAECDCPEAYQAATAKDKSNAVAAAFRKRYKMPDYVYEMVDRACYSVAIGAVRKVAVSTEDAKFVIESNKGLRIVRTKSEQEQINEYGDLEED